MIDALYKARLDRLWDRLGVRVARSGLSANGVTMIALALNAATCLGFVWHRDPLAFGLSLAAVELLDNLDGAVARVTGQSSRAGSFLDAATDRYKETFPLLVLGIVTGHWPACFLAISGSLITSYNQARAQVEGAGAFGRQASPEAHRRRLPDLFERFERVALLCIGLVASPLLPADFFFGGDLVYLVLWVLAVMTHVTALQRLARGWQTLRGADPSP